MSDELRVGRASPLTGLDGKRYGDDLEEATLALHPVTRWVSAGPTRQDADEAKGAEAIGESLAAQTEPVEEPAIHEAVTGAKAVRIVESVRYFSDRRRRRAVSTAAKKAVADDAVTAVPGQLPLLVDGEHGGDGLSGQGDEGLEGGGPHSVVVRVADAHHRSEGSTTMSTGRSRSVASRSWRSPSSGRAR